MSSYVKQPVNKVFTWVKDAGLRLYVTAVQEPKGTAIGAGVGLVVGWLLGKIF